MSGAYEIYVFRDGRWSLLQRYEEARRAAMIDLARRALALPEVRGVCVIQESAAGRAAVRIIFQQTQGAGVPAWTTAARQRAVPSLLAAAPVELVPGLGRLPLRRGAPGRDRTAAAAAQVVGLALRGLAALVGVVLFLWTVDRTIAAPGPVTVRDVVAVAVAFALLAGLLTLVLRTLLRWQSPWVESVPPAASGVRAARPRPPSPEPAAPAPTARTAPAHDEPDTAPWPGVERAALDVLAFFARELEQLRRAHPGPGADGFDPSHPYAYELFLAGACEGYAAHAGLDPRRIPALIARCLMVLRDDPAHNRAFAAGLRNRLADPKAAAIHAAGKDAIGRHLAHAAGAAGPAASTPAAGRAGVPGAWLAVTVADPERSALGPEMRALMTAYLDLLHSIVAAHHGELHESTAHRLGAWLPRADAAVAAALSMQTTTTAHRRLNPNLPLVLRVGIETGSTEADLEAAMALCQAAAPGEVRASPRVRTVAAPAARYTAVDAEGRPAAEERAASFVVAPHPGGTDVRL